jgi:hypothetical protein
MWECEWKTTFEEIKQEINDRVISINPRVAYFDGRTNASKLRVRGKKLKYIDNCSLYPTVIFYEKFPVGHPVEIIKLQNYDPNWFVLIKCEVQPPRKLYHPVLPVKEEKLMFPLCGKCGNLKNRVDTDIERRFIGIWSTPEINKAFEMGYKIKKMYEACEETSTNIFKSYIAKFLKKKIETSEWENDYSSKELYVEDVKNKLVIEFDNITQFYTQQLNYC